VLRLLGTANVIHSSPNLVTMTMEWIRFYESLALTTATRRNISEDDILQNQCILPQLRRQETHSMNQQQNCNEQLMISPLGHVNEASNSMKLNQRISSSPTKRLISDQFFLMALGYRLPIHVISIIIDEFVLVISFIALLYNSLLLFRNN
jgi:hypothetical protein